MFEWITGFILLCLIVTNILSMYRIAELEKIARYIEIRSNTNEANINKLFYFRTIEVDFPNLTAEEKMAHAEELKHTNSLLGERNTYLRNRSS